MIRLLLFFCCTVAPLIQGAPIVYAEYVISTGNPDNDPGLGNGTEISLAGNVNSATLSVSIPPSALSLDVPGSYLLSVRIKDSSNLWTTLTRTFQVSAPLPVLPEQGALTHVEAYVSAAEIPNDVETGLGISVLSPPTAPQPSGHYSRVFLPSDLEGLAPGIYRLAMRARSADGLWSAPVSRTFAILARTEPQFYYPRWRMKNSQGTILQSGALSEAPLETFPRHFAARIPLTGMLPGNHTLEVSLEDLLGAPARVVDSDFEVVTHRTLWDEIYFKDPVIRSNPSLSGPSADPNGDGVTNAMAFVLGLDPEQSHDWVLRALQGAVGSPRAKIKLPQELPPGAVVRIKGNSELSSSLSIVTEILPPLNISTIPTFSSNLQNDVQGNPLALFLTPPTGGVWDTRGFFGLEIEYSGQWPW